MRAIDAGYPEFEIASTRELSLDQAYLLVPPPLSLSVADQVFKIRWGEEGG